MANLWPTVARKRLLFAFSSVLSRCSCATSQPQCSNRPGDQRCGLLRRVESADMDGCNCALRPDCSGAAGQLGGRQEFLSRLLFGADSQTNRQTATSRLMLFCSEPVRVCSLRRPPNGLDWRQPMGGGAALAAPYEALHLKALQRPAAGQAEGLPVANNKWRRAVASCEPAPASPGPKSNGCGGRNRPPQRRLQRRRRRHDDHYSSGSIPKQTNERITKRPDWPDADRARMRSPGHSAEYALAADEPTGQHRYVSCCPLRFLGGIPALRWRPPIDQLWSTAEPAPMCRTCVCVCVCSCDAVSFLTEQQTTLSPRRALCFNCARISHTAPSF